MTKKSMFFHLFSISNEASPMSRNDAQSCPVKLRHHDAAGHILAIPGAAHSHFRGPDLYKTPKSRRFTSLNLFNLAW